MSICEKCWSDAFDPYGDQAERYHELIKERKDHPCTPEQQAGEYATLCGKCGRKTRHQWTTECMNCHDKPEGHEGGSK